ncbi:MAG TPA: OmpA family protein [Polyangia bacterium]|nr:OmpA family protein [Polyangia bacterium]
MHKDWFWCLPVLVALGGCATPPKLKEIVALEKLRDDPTLSDPDRKAFDLLAAADGLLIQSLAEWEKRNLYEARRDALLGQIKLKTAVAILQAEASSRHIDQMEGELAIARDEQSHLDDQLAAASEEVALLQRWGAVKTSVAQEREAMSGERKKLADQLADAKRRADALDGLRRAELAVKTAETVEAPRFAKGRYDAAVGMLQAAHTEYDAGHWAEALARTTMAESTARASVDEARPAYERAARSMSAGARDRALEADATAVPGVTVRLAREGELQRLVLVLHGLFSDRKTTLSPEGGKALDAVKDLLAKYPSYPLQLTGYTDDQGKPDDLVALSLARANAVYWALVTRGIDPKRVSIDGKGPANPLADDSTASGRAENLRVELSILYHASE